MLTVVCRTIVSTRVVSRIEMPMQSDNYLAKFGDNIRSHRLRLNMSQEVLAAKAGVHRTYIGMIERGEKNATLDSIRKLADALGVEPYELLKLDDVQ